MFVEDFYAKPPYLEIVSIRFNMELLPTDQTAIEFFVSIKHSQH